MSSSLCSSTHLPEMSNTPSLPDELTEDIIKLAISDLVHEERHKCSRFPRRPIPRLSLPHQPHLEKHLPASPLTNCARHSLDG